MQVARCAFNAFPHLFCGGLDARARYRADADGVRHIPEAAGCEPQTREAVISPFGTAYQHILNVIGIRKGRLQFPSFHTAAAFGVPNNHHRIQFGTVAAEFGD